MAALTSAEIAKLVQEIDELRRTAGGTLIDQAALKTRYAAATTGILLGNGRFDSKAWEALTDDERTAAEAKLTSLKQDLLGPWPGTDDGPADVHNLMHKEYASNRMIRLLTAFALFGLLFDLSLIIHEWDTATGGDKGILDFCFLKSLSSSCVVATPAPSPSTGDAATATPNQAPSTPSSASLATPSPSPEVSDAVTVSPTATSSARPPAATPRASPKASPSPTATPGNENKDNKSPTIATKAKVTEQAVLWMVILLGALGGFLHLASSMANFVGNRQLLRSWVVYYVLIPFQGAALAPLVYLLLRVGVLNPANPSPVPGATSHPTDSLNLIGIYAFAALTGLFSKQAIEMMAEVFSTIFKKVGAKDSLDKPKKPGE